MDQQNYHNNAETGNQLYPVFFKMEQLETLIVGGGIVALEKLRNLLTSSPQSKITLVAPEIHAQIWQLAQEYPHIRVYQKRFEVADIKDKDLMMVAVGNHRLSARIVRAARRQRVPVNVADTPYLCDFYLGAIVTKGDLKIAISTNGKSPAMAKRLREILNEILPEGLHQAINHLNRVRERLKNDFRYKIRALNELTSKFLIHHEHLSNRSYQGEG